MVENSDDDSSNTISLTFSKIACCNTVRYYINVLELVLYATSLTGAEPTAIYLERVGNTETATSVPL